MHHIDSWTRRQRALVAGMVVAGAAFTLPASAAGAGPSRPDDPTAPLVEPDGVIPEGVPSDDGGGSGGTSTRSGCRRVTVKNEYETALGATAYYFNQVTRWCWDRDARRVQDVSLGYYLEDVDPLFIYRGHTSHNRYFYEYRAGYKNSGYISDRQARFENCVPTPSGQVCLGSTYPRNITRAHDNGTWSWNTY
jgi:hypothetical protein